MLVLKACRAEEDPLEGGASLVSKDRLEVMVDQETRDHLEGEDRLVEMEATEQRVNREIQAHQVLLDYKVVREALVVQECLARLAQGVEEEELDHQAGKARLEFQGLQETTGELVTKDQGVHQVFKEAGVVQAPRGLVDYQEKMAKEDHLDPLEQRVKKEALAAEESKELMG